MREQRLYEFLATTIGAYHNCVDSNNKEWIKIHRQRIEKILPEELDIDFDESKANRLVLEHESVCNLEHLEWQTWQIEAVPDFRFGVRFDKMECRTDNVEEGDEDFVAEAVHYLLNQPVEQQKGV